MPKQNFSLDAGGPKSLQLSWKGAFKDFEISLNGASIGKVEGGMEALREGREFALPDGRILQVKFEQQFMAGGLRVNMDGKPVPGSEGDPLTKVRGAAGFLIFIAIINLLFGVLALIGVEFLVELGIGWFSILVGLVYLGLGLWSRRPSLTALILATIIYGIDSVFAILSPFLVEGGRPFASGWLFRVLVLYFLITAIQALRKKNQNSTMEPA